MLKYFEGTVFNAGTQAIVNTVNCVGVMGKGIALEFSLRYPKMFKYYREACKNKEIQVGKISYFKDEMCTIVNFPTKWHFKYPSKLEWVEEGLKDFTETYHRHGLSSIAFPKLGTSNGGLRWERVRLLMEKHLSNLDIDVIICLDETSVAQGTEAEMVRIFNEKRNLILNEIPSIPQKQKKLLGAMHPIERFWNLSGQKGIGMTTYAKLFKLCYSHVINKDYSIRGAPKMTQGCLFDSIVPMIVVKN